MNEKDFLSGASVLLDPTRLQIVELLSWYGILCACSLLSHLSIRQGTLSHHMKVLTESGLVHCTKKGKWCYYRLDRKRIAELGEFLTFLSSEPKEEEDVFCSCGGEEKWFFRYR